MKIYVTVLTWKWDKETSGACVVYTGTSEQEAYSRGKYSVENRILWSETDDATYYIETWENGNQVDNITVF